MGRKEDLEGHICESYELIHEYEDILRLSNSPKEKARARRALEEQWAFIEGYLSEYLSLCRRIGTPVPAHIGDIIAHFEAIPDKWGLSGIEEAPSTAATQPAPPGVSVSLLTDIVPTAYCHHLDANAFPLITVTLDNTGRGCANAALCVSTTIEDYSDTAIASPRVPRGEQVRVPLLPLLKPAAVATLNEIRPATLRVTVEQTAPTERTLYDQTQRIELHARDTALLAVKATDGSIVDLTEYLAAWITPRHPEIEKLLRQAAEHHPDQQFVGYQGAPTLAQGAEIVRAQARAIFTALRQDANLVGGNRRHHWEPPGTGQHPGSESATVAPGCRPAARCSPTTCAPWWCIER